MVDVGFIVLKNLIRVFIVSCILFFNKNIVIVWKYNCVEVIL